MGSLVRICYEFYKKIKGELSLSKLFFFEGVPDGPAVTEVIKAYIEKGGSNVALLNWDYLASKPVASLAISYLKWAIPNAKQVIIVIEITER